MHPVRIRPALLALLLVLAAAPAAAAASVSPPTFSAHGSVEQVYATGVLGSTPLTLVDRLGHVVARKRADAQGGVLFRNVAPGRGYRLRQGAEQSAPLRVL